MIVEFSEDDVRRIAAEAERLTDGAFKMQGVGGDLAHGTRYVDGVEQIVWLGKRGAQEAAVYYAHGAVNYADRADRADDVPEFVRMAADPHLGSNYPTVREWADRGANVGEFRWRVRHGDG